MKDLISSPPPSPPHKEDDDDGYATSHRPQSGRTLTKRSVIAHLVFLHLPVFIHSRKGTRAINR